MKILPTPFVLSQDETTFYKQSAVTMCSEPQLFGTPTENIKQEFGIGRQNLGKPTGIQPGSTCSEKLKTMQTSKENVCKG